MIRRFGRAISDNLASILLASLLAIIIWANAVRQNNPNETDQIFLPVQTYASPDIIYNTEIAEVQVEIEAPESIMTRINSSPSPMFQAVVDLTSVSTGEQDVPIEIQFTNEATGEFEQDELDQIIVNSRFPSQSTVNLDREITRDIPIRVIANGSVAPTHRSGEPLTNPEVIVVTGAASTINQIKEARVTIFPDNTRESISVSRIPIFYDGAGEVVNIGELATSAESVNVTIEVEERANTGDIGIKSDWTGEIADDHRLLAVVSDPLSVLVTGPPSVINGLRQTLIEAEPIDITGLTETRTFEVRLNLPDGVTRVDTDSPIAVTARIEPITTLDVVVVKPEAIGLADSLTATLLTDAVEVNVFGPLAALRSLNAEDMRVEVDLFEITEPGEYQIQPQVNVPEQRGIEFRSIDPSEVTVFIEETIEPTLTITETAPISDTETLEDEEGWTVPHDLVETRIETQNLVSLQTPQTIGFDHHINHNYYNYSRKDRWQTL